MAAPVGAPWFAWQTDAMSALTVVGLVLAALAGIMHVAIFAMESIGWSRPAIWRRFGVRSQDEADAVKPMAFNQGFYNLFLAIGTGLGIVLFLVRGRGGGAELASAGFGVLVFSLASMLLAAVVLISSSPKLARAAAIQGVPPALAIACLVLGVASA